MGALYYKLLILNIILPFLSAPDGDVRLRGGSASNEGRVEVYYNRTWGTVCDDFWGLVDAQVVCRQLGFVSASRAVTGAGFGAGNGSILFDNVKCSGVERTLLECPRLHIGDHNCLHSEDAGVVCDNEFALRLVNEKINSTDNTAEGRVEVYHDGRWGSICDDGWSLTEAEVACNQLGFEGAVAAVVESQFGGRTSTSLIWMDQVRCTGEENYISSCSFGGWGVHDCSNTENAGVICKHNASTVYFGEKFDLRLVNGPSDNEGRLEVLYDGTWGTVCDDRFTILDAQIACTQLGYVGAERVRSLSYYGSGTGPITLDNVECRGSEQYLYQCIHHEFYSHDCSHSEDVGIVCSNNSNVIKPNATVRLVGGSEGWEGRVQVGFNGTMGTVCDDNWDFLDAVVVCKQLGYPGAISATHGATFGQGTGNILMDDVECNGAESNLGQCDYLSLGEHNCGHNEDAGVVCLESVPDVPIRLRGGASSAEGRVELYYNGKWQTVCDDGWDYPDAVVVCRQLEFFGAVSALSRAAFGPGSSDQEVLLDEVGCVGTESELLDCSHEPVGYHDCSHSEDASVICDAHMTPLVRLVGGASPSEGLVQIQHAAEWGSVCGAEWTSKEAGVVCRQLGYPEATRLANRNEFGVANGSVILQNVYCTGFEAFLASCTHDPFGNISIPSCQNHTGDVGVVCAGERITAPVRLAGANSSYQGRVEVLYSGVWGTVCDDFWDADDAKVVCRMLGHNTEGAQAVGNTRFGSGIGPIWLDDVECNGTEIELANCPRNAFGDQNCLHSEDAGVICKPGIIFPLRLSSSSFPHQGVVEVNLNISGHEWVRVCGEGFRFSDAEVVCRQLGYPGVSRFYKSGLYLPTTDTSPRLISRLGCVGNEMLVSGCNISTTENETCDTDATLFCREYELDHPVRLVNGSKVNEGQIQLFYQGYWGYVCDVGFGLAEARVVCRQLGFLGVIRALINSPFYPNEGRISLSGFSCSGNESSIAECSQLGLGGNGCDVSHEAGVECTAPPHPVKLVGTNSSANGTVLIYSNGRWGTVCDDFWDILDALVVCKQLGFPAVTEAVKENRFGIGSEYSFLLDNVFCRGTELLLSSCESLGWNVHNCAHTEAAGVVCSDIPRTNRRTQIRLVGGVDQYTGRLEIFHEEEWGTVCDDSWSISNSEVACRQLGFEGPAGAYSAPFFSQASGRIWLDDVTCVGTESDIGNCYSNDFGTHNCLHFEDVWVGCLVGVFRPVDETYDVRLVGGSADSLGKVEIFYQGHWGIICAVQWDLTAASVVCAQLGYDHATQALNVNAFGAREDAALVWLDGIECVGHENRLVDCSRSIWAPGTCNGRSIYGSNSIFNPVSVVCTRDPVNPNPIRLTRGQKLSEGTVEIFYNNQWGTICDANWSLEEANLACKAVGYRMGASMAVNGSHFGAGVAHKWLDGLECTGLETFIQECPHGAWGEVSAGCGDSHSAGVVCEGVAAEVRLYGGNASSGVVQVQYAGVWGTICSHGWNFLSATVVCKQLGLGLASDFGAAGDTFTPRNSSTTVWLDAVSCSGIETEINSCSYDKGISYCTPKQDAYVVCSNSTEVVKGAGDLYTNLELRRGREVYGGFVWTQLNGVNGTVCTPTSGNLLNVAKVICSQLNLDILNVSVESRDSGLSVSTPILISEISCIGTETDINTCYTSVSSPARLCTHQHDLFVSCSPYRFCTALTVQSPLRIQAMPELVPNGFIAALSCSQGLLQGSSEVECTVGGVWKFPSGPISCLQVNCEFVPDSNTYILNSSHTIFTFGSTIEVLCKPGSFIPQSQLTSANLTCDVNGWSVPATNCTPPIVTPPHTTCEFVPDSNTYILNSSDTIFTFGSTIEVQCKPGSFIPQSQLTSANLTCGVNGWSVPATNCTPPIVTPPHTTCEFVPDSNTYILNSSDTIFTFGSTIEVLCKPDSFIPQSQLTSANLTCGVNGWSFPATNCSLPVITTTQPNLQLSIGGVIGGSVIGVGLVMAILIVVVLILIILLVYKKLGKTRAAETAFTALEEEGTEMEARYVALTTQKVSVTSLDFPEFAKGGDDTEQLIADDDKDD